MSVSYDFKISEYLDPVATGCCACGFNWLLLHLYCDDKTR